MRAKGQLRNTSLAETSICRFFMRLASILLFSHSNPGCYFGSVVWDQLVLYMFQNHLYYCLIPHLDDAGSNVYMNSDLLPKEFQILYIEQSKLACNCISGQVATNRENLFRSRVNILKKRASNQVR